jgi:hypothetical protein
MLTNSLICGQCNDPAEPVTPVNGSTLLAKTATGDVVVALHRRCEGAWADKHNCETLVPLRKMRWQDQSYSRASAASH